MPSTGPANWLIEEYELARYADADREGAWALGGSVVVQPMFTIKSVMDSGHAMRVTPADYRDSKRWWL